MTPHKPSVPSLVYWRIATLCDAISKTFCEHMLLTSILVFLTLAGISHAVRRKKFPKKIANYRKEFSTPGFIPGFINAAATY